MRFSRARYVTLCQQSLVTAAVLAVGVSAAGVKTLDIVPPPGTSADAAGTTPEASTALAPRDAGRALQKRERRVAPTARREAEVAPTEVDVAPVTPKVREVKVRGIAGRTPAARPQAKPTPRPRTVRPEHKHEHAAPGAPKRLVALSEPQTVRGYATVGVTWKDEADYSEAQISVEVRTEENGVWSEWAPAQYHDEHAPDSGSVEGGGADERAGTDALVIGDVDRVQMRTETSDGSTPPDLELAVIDPGRGVLAKEAPAIDTAAAPAAGAGAHGQELSTELSTESGESVDQVALSAQKTSPKPLIYSRAQWGANERMREQSAPDYGTIKTGFVHHTVNANNYTAAQVPALLRGIYAYHTQSRGWRDVGYNFLVDRFGRIWEGRYGGVARAVVGAHTSGYNESSFAMSAIGNFETATPPQVVLDAYAKLFAWKLSLSNVRADATGLRVNGRTFRGINGHRDAGSTACPGKYLYARLATIRGAAQRIQNAAQSGSPVTPPKPTPTPTPTPKPTPKPTPTPAPPVRFTSPTQPPQSWTRQTSGITFPKASDIAGSSHPDLVLKRRDGLVQVLPTGGQTSFGAAVRTPGKWSTMDLVAAAGDLTGDGRGDVLARLKSDASTRVYVGDGTGRVKVPGATPTRLFRYATAITAAGDWNRDGRNDVLMKDRFSRLWMVPGLGNGSFGAGRLLSRSWGGFTSTAVVGDLTGDGRPDLAAIHHTGYLYVVASTSSGTLGTPVRRRTVGTLYDSVAGSAGDLTGDSNGDVVVRSSRTGRVSVIAGAGKGQLGGTLGWFTASVGVNRLSAGAMTGSAQGDLVGVSADGTQLMVLPHNGATNLRPALASNLRVSGATQVLGVGDWNRDGKGDVVTRESAGDQLVLRPGLGDGRFGTGRSMSKGWRTVTRLAAVGDVTGDRVPDLAGKTARGSMTVFPGNGSTGFLPPRTAPASLRTFNLVGGSAWQPLRAGTTWVSSDGSFVPFGGVSGGDPAAYDWIVGPGDVDGDGAADMVTRDAKGSIWLLPGKGTGYGERRLVGTGFTGYSLGG